MNETILGTLLNERYRLDAELGRGGMGVVFRAYDLLLDRQVAVKLLSASRLGTTGRARLLQEARAVARLKHPNIISVYDAGRFNEFSYVVMELLEGASLFEQRPASLEESIAVIRQVCAALEHAHTNGIVHRDLKLENVIVAPDGKVTLTDFGLARSIASRVSMEETLVGTVFYLAPEQALGQPVDGRADLYALGVMLYELAAGRLPFTSDDPLAVISQHLHAPVVPPSTHNSAIPAALDALILELMSKQPEERPASAREVLAALDRLDEPLLALPPAVPDFVPIARLARGRPVGREREFAEVKALWKLASSAPGEMPVLLVTGESGAGKTPFIRDIKALAEVSGGKVLKGDCYPEGSAPYAPVAQMIQTVLPATQPLLIKDEPERELAFAPASPAGQLLAEQAEQAPELEGLPAQLLNEIVSLVPDLHAHYPHLHAGHPLDAQTEQLRLFENLVTLFGALAKKAPLLLVVEDVQWADGGTLYLLRHLARRTRALKLKLLIVMTYRDYDLEEVCCLSSVLFDLNRERLAAHVKLAPFTREQTGELLAAMFQEPVEPEFLEGIYRVTEGNLFFVEEICKALIESGRLYREEGRWRRPKLDQIQIPQSIQATIQARVSKLPGEVQDVLRLAAIIGREFDFEVLQKASELDEEALIEALETAERVQLVEEMKAKPRGDGLAVGVTFSFAHALIVTTLRESLSGMRRRRMHRRVAHTLEAVRQDEDAYLESLAYHYEQAGDAQRARQYYLRAGERALTVYANEMAENYTRAALELAVPGAERAILLSRLGEALFRQSWYKQAIQAWQEAIQLYQDLGDHDNLARIFARAARAAWYAGEAGRGLELALEGLAAVQKIVGGAEPAETAGMAALLHETARAYRFNEQHEQALPLCRQALEMAERLGLVEVQAEALATLGIFFNQPAEERQAALTRAVELAESAGLYASAARAHLNLSGYLHEKGETVAAREHARRAKELARQMGINAWEHDFLGTEASFLLELGDFTGAEEAINRMRQLQSSLPHPGPAESFTEFLWAHLLKYRGEWAEAIQVYQRALIEPELRPDMNLLFEINLAMAEAMLESGRLDEAQLALEEAMRLQSEQQDSHKAQAYPLFLLAMAYSQQGRFAEAHHILSVSKQLACDDPAWMVTGFVTWAEARLASAEKRWPEALAAYAEVLGVLDRAEMRWYQARATLDLSEVHLARGEPGDQARAWELLNEAETRFEQLGVPRYVQWVRNKMKAWSVNTA